jgi:hypothetical protein
VTSAAAGACPRVRWRPVCHQRHTLVAIERSLLVFLFQQQSWQHAVEINCASKTLKTVCLKLDGCAETTIGVCQHLVYKRLSVSFYTGMLNLHEQLFCPVKIHLNRFVWSLL